MDKKMLSEFYSGNETVLGRNENLLAEMRTTLAVKPEPKETNDMFRIYFWYWTSELSAILAYAIVLAE